MSSVHSKLMPLGRVSRASASIVACAWPELKREHLGANAKVVFDQRVEVQGPSFAEDPMNVPITVRVKGLPDVQRVVVLVDRNPIRKVLESAIANARVKADKTAERFDERELVVAPAFIDEGPTMKRFRPRAQGRAFRIKKRTSHITVVVAERPATVKKG